MFDSVIEIKSKMAFSRNRFLSFFLLHFSPQFFFLHHSSTEPLILIDQKGHFDSFSITAALTVFLGASFRLNCYHFYSNNLCIWWHFMWHFGRSLQCENFGTVRGKAITSGWRVSQYHHKLCFFFLLALRGREKKGWWVLWLFIAAII